MAERPSFASIPRPDPFLLPLVPLLFSPDPIPLPAAVLAKPAQQAIHYLELDPETHDAYWTLGTKDAGVTLARRAIVETGSLESLRLGSPQYSFDQAGELKALVPVSLVIPSCAAATSSDPPDPFSLNVVLLWEEKESDPTSLGSTTAMNGTSTDDDRPSWTFLRLEAPRGDLAFEHLVSRQKENGTNPHAEAGTPTWFATVEEAVDAVIEEHGATSDGQDERSLESTRWGQARTDEASEGDYDEYGTRRRTDGLNGTGTGSDPKKFKTREEMAEGEGTTPGAYGDSSDFWAGWSDSDGEGDDEAGAVRAKGIVVNGGPGGDDEDESYWSGYGQVEDQVDDGRTESLVDVPVRSPSSSAARPSAIAAAPCDVSTAPDDRPKTRSRRSSTVTPFSLKSIPSPSKSSPSTNNVAESTPHDPRSSAAGEYTSFLSLDSPAPTSGPFDTPRVGPSSSFTSTATVPSVGTPREATIPVSRDVGDRTNGSNAAVNRDGNADDEDDEALRSVIEGAWKMYRKRAGADRFRAIVAEVLTNSA
ncbi:hypothetical protein JCM10212_005208 [Sporobolomyces blumeae]